MRLHPSVFCAGAHAAPCCTLRYAPPELVDAVAAKQRLLVEPCHDVWSLGVMAFETIAGTPAFSSSGQIFACARGAEVYPWTATRKPDAPAAWRRSRLRPVVQACLARDPTRRPSAEGLVAELARLCNASTAT